MPPAPQQAPPAWLTVNHWAWPIPRQPAEGTAPATAAATGATAAAAVEEQGLLLPPPPVPGPRCSAAAAPVTPSVAAQPQQHVAWAPLAGGAALPPGLGLGLVGRWASPWPQRRRRCPPSWPPGLGAAPGHVRAPGRCPPLQERRHPGYLPGLRPSQLPSPPQQTALSAAQLSPPRQRRSMRRAGHGAEQTGTGAAVAGPRLALPSPSTPQPPPTWRRRRTSACSPVLVAQVGQPGMRRGRVRGGTAGAVAGRQGAARRRRAGRTWDPMDACDASNAICARLSALSSRWLREPELPGGCSMGTEPQRPPLAVHRAPSLARAVNEGRHSTQAHTRGQPASPGRAASVQEGREKLATGASVAARQGDAPFAYRVVRDWCQKARGSRDCGCRLRPYPCAQHVDPRSTRLLPVCGPGPGKADTQQPCVFKAAQTPPCAAEGQVCLWHGRQLGQR